MADHSLVPSALLDTEDGRDVVREMLAKMAAMVMEKEVSSRCNAALGERSGSRTNHRNGYRERSWDTRAGAIDLQIPKLRHGSYYPEFLEPRRTAEKALVAVIQEAYLQGVSTRSVDELVKALGASGVSRSEVSRLCKEVDERVQAFLDRRLAGNFPYVWMDATYPRVRDGGCIVGKATVVAIGLSEDGRREVLGMKVGDSETEDFWSEFIQSLRARGLTGVKLVTSDSHQGLKNAIAKRLSCSWQRCRVHAIAEPALLRSQGQKGYGGGTIRTAFSQSSQEEAIRQWRIVVDSLQGSFPKVSTLMQAAEPDALAYMAYSNELWPMLASTNGLERLNRELKRRADVVQIFPNNQSVTRLLGAILMEQHDEWQVARKRVSTKSMTGVDTKDDALLARGAGR